MIRWLGDPIARLIGGDDILKPRTVLLADEALPSEARETVESRLALWIAAHIRKVLGPLEALSEPSDAPEPAREIAKRVAQALGVLERDRVRQQVKGLDQNARSALRKLGVRFGASYIFVPALLKPGARALCAQLWSLRRGTEPGAERLLGFAAAGRTSFAAEAPLSADTYRIAGFRLCGDRVVRVDIVERLTDLIRAAIPDRMRLGASGGTEASGFVVAPQMTSLTGCAGESFASILRSLGYESHKVKKAEYEATLVKAPTEPIVAAATHAPEAAAPEADTALETTGPVAEAGEIAGLRMDSPAAVAIETAPAIQSEPPVEAAAQSTPIGDTLVQTTAARDAPPLPDERIAVASEADIADPSAEEEWVEVWRPAPRLRPPPPQRRHMRAGESEGTVEANGRRRDFRRPRNQGAQSASTAESVSVAPGAEAAAQPNAPIQEPQRRDGGRPNRQGGRPHPFKGPRADENRPREGRPDGGRGGRDRDQAPPRKEPRAQPIDMDSPFAKLLALKPLLEGRDKRS